MNKTDPVEYEQIAREVFAPIYPVIAQQIITETGIKHGKCLDIGTGTGYLGLAMAEASDLEVCLMDISPEMINYAKQNINHRRLQHKVQALYGDVHKIPIPDQSVNLVVSRGSVFFWDDLAQAFKEIYRILLPGGMAFIGGGFGSEQLKKQIDEKMKEKDERWLTKHNARQGGFSSRKFPELFDELNISFKIRKDNGFWVIITKDHPADS